jgi:hypothetical protein
MNRLVYESFQQLVEELHHAKHCDQPEPFQQRPYGVVSVKLGRNSANPVYFGSLLAEEARTGSVIIESDDLAEVLERTMVTMEDDAMVLYWPGVKYNHDL